MCDGCHGFFLKGAEYVEECIFCKIVRREIPAQVVYEDGRVLVFQDIRPAAPVHYLLIPKKHIPTFFEVGEEDEGVLGHLQRVAALVAREAGLDKKGFRLVSNCLEGGGQLVFHLHYHLLAGRELGWPPG
jgi:histidine triad (HIT) family protein